MRKTRFTDWQRTKKELLKDVKVKAAYETLGPEFAVIGEIIKARVEKGMTQKELAKKMGTKQSVISRLERGNGNPSLKFLQRLAQALELRLMIRFQ
jgi:ribosome-binding protein aMBF1 (putative translation factor)